MYPEFSVPGVKPEDVWRLFNTSNYRYYKQTVEDLKAGKCPFCQIDAKRNHILYENDLWILWKNEVAPRSGQECQLVAPSRRHVENILDLGPWEWIRFHDLLQWANKNLGVGGDGVWVVRTGDPARNAKSVPHLHFNFQMPTGKERVEVTIAKSEEDFHKKLPVLHAFEKYRVAEEEGNPHPQLVLSAEEWALIESKMYPPKTVK
jgi:diadenosine tetraphosphate (Ap4A) HIT family hydrolase